MKRQHKAQEVYLNQLGQVEVDEKIVDLVTALCDLGWTTRQSCQNNNGRVWISFYDSSFAAEFMELIAKTSPNINHQVLSATNQEYDAQPDRFKVKDRWWIDAFAEVKHHPSGLWTGEVQIRISIRFPRKHLQEVTEIVVASAERRNSRFSYARGTGVRPRYIRNPLFVEVRDRKTQEELVD